MLNMEALAQQPPETVANSAKKDETEAKLKIGREKKEGGDKAFKEGDTKAGELTDSYSLHTLACHIKNENWKRAVETANQILKKSPENKKALLRKGKGLLGQGFTEKAIDVFQALEKQDPEDAEVKRELAAARAADKAATSKGLKKFKGFLNRPGASGSSGDVEEVTNVLEVSRIEEVS
ncbi:hypothetical protein FRB96_003319 [Tulasnella sp. 330]|nr:hypothetical protein FRB96_003319 [Tulasnella sp. 330]KAG8889986.1 hypothetical protein FRB98_001721 [Tulasnella sp. 332]